MSLKTNSMRSRRLRFEPLQVEHAAPLEDALTDWRVSEHFIEVGPGSLDELRTQFAQMIKGPPAHIKGETWINFAVRLDRAPVFIGRVEATIQGAHAEIAYLIGSKFWGQGYGLEAASWIEKFCESEHAVTTFWVTVAPSNHRSIKLASRLGYHRCDKPASPYLTSYDPGDLVYRRSCEVPRE